MRFHQISIDIYRSQWAVVIESANFVTAILKYTFLIFRRNLLLPFKSLLILFLNNHIKRHPTTEETHFKQSIKKLNISIQAYFHKNSNIWEKNLLFGFNKVKIYYYSKIHIFFSEIRKVKLSSEKYFASNSLWAMYFIVKELCQTFTYICMCVSWLLHSNSLEKLLDQHWFEIKCNFTHSGISVIK